MVSFGEGTRELLSSLWWHVPRWLVASILGGILLLRVGVPIQGLGRLGLSIVLTALAAVGPPQHAFLGSLLQRGLRSGLLQHLVLGGVGCGKGLGWLLVALPSRDLGLALFFCLALYLVLYGVAKGLVLALVCAWGSYSCPA